jgi:hypothetical protein
MMFDFFNFIFDLQINIGIKHQNGNFCLKNYAGNSEERFHLYDRFRVIYFWNNDEPKINHCFIKVNFSPNTVLKLMLLLTI